jgi:hypothetical protein
MGRDRTDKKCNTQTDARALWSCHWISVLEVQLGRWPAELSVIGTVATRIYICVCVRVRVCVRRCVRV